MKLDNTTGLFSQPSTGDGFRQLHPSEKGGLRPLTRAFHAEKQKKRLQEYNEQHQHQKYQAQQKLSNQYLLRKTILGYTRYRSIMYNHLLARGDDGEIGVVSEEEMIRTFINNMNDKKSSKLKSREFSEHPSHVQDMIDEGFPYGQWIILLSLVTFGFFQFYQAFLRTPSSSSSFKGKGGGNNNSSPSKKRKKNKSKK